MHGQKSPTIDRDVELCKHSWPFIAEIVERELENSNESDES